MAKISRNFFRRPSSTLKGLISPNSQKFFYINETIISERYQAMRIFQFPFDAFVVHQLLALIRQGPSTNNQSIKISLIITNINNNKYVL